MIKNRLPTELLVCIGEASDIVTKISISKIYGNVDYIIRRWGTRRYIRLYALKCVNEGNYEELKSIMSVEQGSFQYIRYHLLKNALDVKDLTCAMLLLKHFETQKCKDFIEVAFFGFRSQLIKILWSRKIDKPNEVSRFTIYLLNSCYRPRIDRDENRIWIYGLVTAPFSHYVWYEHLDRFRKDLKEMKITSRMIRKTIGILMRIRKDENVRRQRSHSFHLCTNGAQDNYLLGTINF